MTEGQFRKRLPKTVEFINFAVGLEMEPTKIEIIKNKVHTAPKKFVKLSKVLSKAFLYDSDQDKRKELCELFGTACKELNIHTSTDYFVSALVDMTKPKEIVISTNVYDMLTSSTNASYSSCYSMNGGEYFNGNLAYIRDSFTLIVFTHCNDIKRKVGRSWAYVFPEQFKLVTGRTYGSIY